MKNLLFHTILFLALITTSAHAGTQVYENTLSSGDKHKITANITASSAQFSIEVSHPTDPITPSTASLKVCKEKDGTNCRSPYVYEETVVVPAGGSINSQTLGKVKNLSIGQDYYFQYADWAVEKFTTEKALDPNGTTDLEKDQYRLLAPFPGMTVLMDPVTCKQQKDTGQVGKNAICDVNGLLNFAFKLMIGITAVVLILRLMYEGYTYIVTDVPYLKTNAKSGFTTALLGLLLALSAYVILNTINPKLVSNTINIDKMNVEVELIGDGTGQINLSTNSGGLPTGVFCPGSGGQANVYKIAKSFEKKVSYSMENRGVMRSDGLIDLDCSSYVSQVLTCAGYSISGVTGKWVSTSTINGVAEKVTTAQISNSQLLLNGKAVKKGDVFGWITPQERRHVVMSLGGTKIIDVHGGKGNKDNAKEMDINFYMNERKFKIGYVYRLPN